MGTIRHATLTSELAGGKVAATEWDAAHDIDLAIADITGLQTAMDGLTGWGAYVNTAAAQSLVAATKVSLTNNAGTVLETQKPADIASFYTAGKIIGRNGDGLGVTVELTFTPSNGTASNFYMAIDIGGSVGEIYPRDYAILRGSGVAHKISYSQICYSLDTWQANGGTVKVEADGPGSVTGVRYVIHRLHKAN